jgi:hypothetical protein
LGVFVPLECTMSVLDCQPKPLTATDFSNHAPFTVSEEEERAYQSVLKVQRHALKSGGGFTGIWMQVNDPNYLLYALFRNLFNYDPAICGHRPLC